MLLTEYDAKTQKQLDKRDWMEEGERIGEARGEARGKDHYARLTGKLLAENRHDNLKYSAKDPEYRQKLYREFEL